MGAIQSEIVEAVVADYLSGMSRAEVARKHHVSQDRVRVWMRQRGFEFTPEEVLERRRRGGRKRTSQRKKCLPGCTCARHQGSNGVLLGYRLCNSPMHQGPRWIPLLNFDAYRRDEEGNAVEWQYSCRACNRIVQRIRVGIKRQGRPYEQRHQRMTPDQYKARRREIHAEKTKNDPAYVDRRREYGRIWSEGKRRRAGVEPRENRKTPGRAQQLYAEPMARWVQNVIPRYQGDNRRLAKVCGVDESTIRRLRTNQIPQITEDLADRILTNEGSTDLWEVFPHLYDEEEVLAAA